MRQVPRENLIAVNAVILLALVGPSASAQVRITAQLDRQAATVGEQFKLIVEVEVSEGQVESQPVLPEIDGLVIRTPYAVQSTQSIVRNNRMSSKATTTFTYPIYAMKEGTYQFQDIHVVQSGKRYTANPVQIVVSKGSGPAVSTGEQAASAQFQAGTGLQLVANFNPPEVYQGQQVILTFTLKTDQPLEMRPRFEDVDVNTFRDFFMYDVTPARITQAPVQSQGKTYYVLEVGRFALFPVPSGELTVPPVNMVVFLPDDRSRGFGFFDSFLREPRRVRITSKAAALKVKPLPTESQPADFQGAVGQLTLSSRTTSKELERGDALSLVVETRGEANFQTVKSPLLPPMEEFTVYDSKDEVQISTGGGRLSGTKTWEYVLVPEEVGTLEIGPVKLPIFNPSKAIYETLSTDPISIQVRESSHQNGDRIVIQGAGGRQREVVLEGEDFRYILTDVGEVEDQSGLLAANPGFLALNAVPIVVVIAAWMAERRRNRLARDPILARRLRAPAHAREILAHAERAKEQSGGEFDALLSKALVEFLDLRFGIPARGMVSEDLGRELTGRGVGGELADRVTGFLAELDASRFAGPENARADIDRRLQRTKELIQALTDAS